MALDKTKSIQHAMQEGCQSGNVIWSQFIKWLPSWFFKKLQSVNHTNFPQKFLFRLKALSHYNVLANVCRRMKNMPSTLAYAEIELKKQREPLSELIPSVC